MCLQEGRSHCAETWCKLCFSDASARENGTAENHLNMETRKASKLLQLQALFINLWIAMVILLFFALRIFDSNIARRIFHSLAAR
jgi:hypothetical protein